MPGSVQEIRYINRDENTHLWLFRNIILELKKKGVATMLISSDMEEIIELSDRAVVMFQGHMTKTLSKSQIDQNTLMNASFDVDEEEEG